MLSRELELREVEVQSEVDLPVEYKGIRIEPAYLIDLLVEGKVIVELKAVDSIAPVHEAQLLTYLRLSRKKVGLLFNFHSPILKDGIVRRVL